MQGEVSPGALPHLLGHLHLGKATGLLLLKKGDEQLQLAFRQGRIVNIDSPSGEWLPLSDPNDSASRAERLRGALGWCEGTYRFQESQSIPQANPELAVSTQGAIGEAVRHLEDPELVRAALGDLERIVVIHVDPDFWAEQPVLSAEDELLLGRVDGARSARELLEQSGSGPESMRSLLGLILRGLVVECAPPAAAAAAATRSAEGVDALRQEIVEAYASLGEKNHFEVLGVPEKAGPAQIDEAYGRLRRQFDPEANRHADLAEVQSILEALCLRIEGAYRVLSRPESRAAYVAELARRRALNPTPARGVEAVGPRLVPNEAERALHLEEQLYQAERHVTKERYWEATQLLEGLIPGLHGRRRQRAQVLLARAYLKNPNWVRRGEELLQATVHEDPTSADAYFTLGTLYKERGLQSRASAMFRKVLELKPDHKGAAAELGSSPALIKKLLRR